MQADSPTPIDALAAPTADGAELIWPSPAQIFELARANRALRSAWRFELLRQPFADVAGPSLRGDPVFVTGHQPDFFHPGVWAKRVAIAAMAGRAGGRAGFVVVDSDVARPPVLAWPVLEAGYCRRQVSDFVPEPPDFSYEQLPAVSASKWKRAFEPVASMGLMPEFAEGFFADASVSNASIRYVDRWAAGVVSVERNLHVPPPAPLLVSGLFDIGRNPAAALFIGHLLESAPAFAVAYNAALANYRRRRGIRGRHHPIPDLLVEGPSAELPLWILPESGPRQRLLVGRRGEGGIEIRTPRGLLASMSLSDLRRDCQSFLRHALGPFCVRPRALALTMFLRMFACDLFVHGIGGAKYDQITDDLFRRFWSVTPPAYACVSATLRLPLRRFGVSVDDHRAAVRSARDLRFNAQRFVQPDMNGPLRELLDARRRAIEESDRLRATRPRSRAARREAFERIDLLNRRLVEALRHVETDIRTRIERIDRELASDRVASSREWFFALYPRSALEALRDRVSRGLER